MSVPLEGPIRVDSVMAEIESAVRDDLRQRLIARGGAADFTDAAIFEQVSATLARAVDRRERDALLVPELLGDDDAWKPAAELRITSHRPVIGPAIVFVKRRLVLPLVRWLLEYTDDNFRRQEYLNRVILACIEELAIENARLRAEMKTRV